MNGEFITHMADSGSALGGTWWFVFGVACLVTGIIVALVLFAIIDTAATDHMLRRQHRDLQYWQSRAMRAEDAAWRD
jgi:hypothetical protein